MNLLVCAPPLLHHGSTLVLRYLPKAERSKKRVILFEWQWTRAGRSWHKFLAREQSFSRGFPSKLNQNVDGKED